MHKCTNGTGTPFITGCDKEETLNTPTQSSPATPSTTVQPTISPTREPVEIYDGPDFGKKADIEVEGHQTSPSERPKEFMVDGNPLTRWAFKQFPTDVFFDFDAPFILSKIHLTWHEVGRTYYYELYASYDGEKWICLQIVRKTQNRIQLLMI